MMAYVALFDIVYPADAQFFLVLLIGITNCDLLPSDKLNSWIFNLNKTESLTP